MKKGAPTKDINKTILFAYFYLKSKQYQSNFACSKYSMINRLLLINANITGYHKLFSFVGHKPKKILV